MPGRWTSTRSSCLGAARLGWMLAVAGLAGWTGVASAVATRQAPPASSDPTYFRDVAPIVLENCAPCHRPGEAGPFNLLTYEDVRRRARQIAEVTASRYMPPWLPEPGGEPLVGERRLSDADLRTLQRWVEIGAPRGAPEDAPAMPQWPEGWQLGTPDLVVRMPRPFELGPEGPDVFRYFVIPVPVEETRFVRSVEFRPDNPRIVHHAIIHVDRTGMVEGRLAEDSEAGGMLFNQGESPDGHFIGWSPGKSPSAGRDDIAWRLEPGLNLLLQLHLQPTGKPEVIQASVGLFFAERPPDREAVGVQLGSYTIDIPAGARDYRVEDSYVLPVDVDLLSVYPHAHYLGKSVRVDATLPDATRRLLLSIPEWDFNWQDQYEFRTPVRLPAGTTVRATITYDNSADNVRNPSQPPVRVRYGGGSTDEMGNVWMQVLPVNPEHLPVLQQDYERKTLTRNIVADLLRLAEDPADPALHRALGVSYLRIGRVNEAIRHLTEAVASEPGHAVGRYNLGTALASQQRFGEALEHFREAARLAPGHAEAHNNLGVSLQALGRFDEAAEAYRAALSVKEEYPEAHNNLGVVLRTQGRTEEAISHFQRALELAPEYAQARRNLEDARAAGSEREGSPPR